MMTTKRYHFQKKLTLKLRLKLQILGSLTIQVQMTWNFSHTYIPIRSIRSQSYRSKKLKQRRYDQKTRSDIEFSKALNSHKTYHFLLKLWEWKRPIVFYNLSKFHPKIPLATYWNNKTNKQEEGADHKRCYGLTTNKWRITRQDKLYWSINRCWSAEGLFPRLSPFITLNHTSPKIS